MAFADLEGSVDLRHAAAFTQLAVVGTQAHRAAHVGHRFLLLHQVYHIVWGGRVHLGRVGITVFQHVAGKFNHHHLHTQADAERRHVVGAGVSHGDDFPFDAAFSEAGTH